MEEVDDLLTITRAEKKSVGDFFDFRGWGDIRFILFIYLFIFALAQWLR